MSKRSRKILSLLLVFAMLFSVGASAASYTVASGDTLAKIARANGTTWEELARINNLSDPHKIITGQVLKLDGAAAGKKAVVTTPMKAGTYDVTVTGMNPMNVRVTLGEKEIKAIAVTSHNETLGIGDVAIAQFPAKIIKAQAVDVDVITGATITSSALLAAVKEAITKAGGNAAEFTGAKVAPPADIKRPLPGAPVPKKWDETFDVVVVGAGFAGLAAAHSSQNAGAKTLLVEKMSVVGGNSKTNGGQYAAYTSSRAAELQKIGNLPVDTAEGHIADTIKGGDNFPRPDLVRNFVLGAPFYLDLLMENGLKIRETLARPGGHYGYRTYVTENSLGSDITNVQYEMVKKSGAEVRVDTKMVQIYREPKGERKVVGIQIQTANGLKNIRATKGVVVATGGFAANKEMRQLHAPMLTPDMPTTNHPGATGEGLVMAQEIGANTTQMSYIQRYPFANPNNGVLDTVAVIPFTGPSYGIVYVDKDGKRYVNEGERRDVCADAAKATGGPSTFAIFNRDVVSFTTDKDLEAGMAADRVLKADTLEELATKINALKYQGVAVNMDGATLAKTIAEHNKYVADGKDTQYGKVITPGVMKSMEKGPYYAIPQWPSVHHTMGGLTITAKTEVTDVWDEVIPNLFASGEVVGGVHGTNRLGSNADPDACVHGYISGQMAATRTLPDFLK